MAIRTVYRSANFKVCYDSEWHGFYAGLDSVPASELADHALTYITSDRQDAIDTCDDMAVTYSTLEVI